MSHYSDIDKNFLKEYRTTVPMEFFKQGNLKQLVEIDTTKAFTAASMKVKSIPILNQFDSWKPFHDGVYILSLSGLTLYMVAVFEGDLFSTRNLILFTDFLTT